MKNKYKKRDLKKIYYSLDVYYVLTIFILREMKCKVCGLNRNNHKLTCPFNNNKQPKIQLK